MDLRTNGATLALAGILTMGLAACGGSADAETADAAPQPVEKADYAEAAAATGTADWMSGDSALRRTPTTMPAPPVMIK